MIKTGIHSLAQLKQPKKFQSMFGGDKRISITLYDQVVMQSNAEELAERILLMFTDERGAYKRTYAKRFEEFDTAVAKFITEHFVSDANLVLHDVGVSDGRTAVDFFNTLHTFFANLNYYASDYDPRVYIIESGNTKVTLSHSIKVIEISFPPFVFNAVRPDRWWRHPINRIVQLWVSHYIVKQMLQKYRDGELKAKELYLFAPTALNLARNDQKFHLQQHNILSKLTMQGHVIRAMNVLNASYFSPEEFKQIAQNLHAGLHENGLLITGSNQDAGSIVNGGIYKRTADGFKEIWRTGSGSPIAKFLEKCN